MKVSKTSSVKKNRIHTSHIDRITKVRNTEAVQAVTPAKKVQNTSYYSSENHLLIYDAYYDSLKKLKKEYKKFYYDEQNFKKAIINFRQNKNQLLNNMKELISKYNMAIQSLERFDNAFETNNVANIVSILKDFEKELNNLGINIIQGKELKLNQKVFIEKIKNSQVKLYFLFNPDKGLVFKLYNAFTNIKVPRKNSNRYKDSDYRGMIFDDKT